MDNLLYYPYINIPDTDWTARTLLYYDKVGSIVPQKYSRQLDNFDPFMKEMIEMKLVELIDPVRTLSNPWEISTPFLNYLKSADIDISRRQKNFKTGNLGRIHRNKFDPKDPIIHVDKFDSDIFYNLEKAGLAVRQDSQWYSVEKTTARELMTFLASVIGGKLNYLPATDQIQKKYTEINKSKKEFKIFRRHNHKREIILKDIIPLPGQINLKKLQQFKNKHSDLLDAFRNRIELIVLDPRIKESTPLFQETIKELKFRKAELSAKMNESKFGDIFFGTICGIAGAFIGSLSSATGTAFIASLPGFTNAVYSALKIERAEDVFDQTGMKYLALLDKRLR